MVRKKPASAPVRQTFNVTQQTWLSHVAKSDYKGDTILSFHEVDIIAMFKATSRTNMEGKKRYLAQAITSGHVSSIIESINTQFVTFNKRS